MDIHSLKEGERILITLNDTDESDTLDFNFVRKISSDESSRIDLARKSIDKWVKSDNETFALVEHAYQKLTSTLRAIKADFATIPTPKMEDALLAINAEFLNLLAMGRLYLDHTQTRLSADKVDAQILKELADYKTATNIEFDANFAYRFFEKLRNYSLHCGFPITDLVASQESINEDGQVEQQFSLTFNRDNLLNDYDSWGAKVKPDLQDQAIDLSIPELTEAYVISLRTIRQKTITPYLARIKDDLDIFVQLIEECKSSPGTAYLIDISDIQQVASGGRTQKMSIKKMPFNELNVAAIYNSL